MTLEAGKAGGITLSQLRTLVTVAEKRSYDLSGGNDRSEMNAARSALQRLAMAIGDPNAPLTVPTGFGQVALTALGEQILPYARSIVGLVEDAAQLDRQVRVAAYSSLMLRLLRYSAKPDSLPFELVPADSARAQGGLGLTQRLANHDVDIAVAPSGQPGPYQRESWLYHWHLRAVGELPDEDVSTLAELCGSELPAYRDRPAVSIEKLAKHPLLIAPTGHRSRGLLEAAAEVAGVNLKIRYELADQGLMLALTKEMKCIAIMPDDVYGAIGANIGPRIVTGGSILRGGYSIYTREPLGTSPTAFERQIFDAVWTIVNAHRPPPPFRH